MNQSKNPEYQAGRVDIAVEQCGAMINDDNFDDGVFADNDVIYDWPLASLG